MAAPATRTPSVQEDVAPVLYGTDGNKENQAPAGSDRDLSSELTKLSIADPAARPQSSLFLARDLCTDLDERRLHQGFMDQALDMARLALKTNETPVGCVLVHNGSVVARGMNATNVTRNGTRHAEFMAISALLSYRPENGEHAVGVQLQQRATERTKEDVADDESELFPTDDDFVKNGHLYPYGQKLHPASRVDRSILRNCVLYVTVEPCVMCAGLLRQLGIRKVYFGAVNDKFGGTGGVFSIHKNSTDTIAQKRHIPAVQSLQASTNAINLPRPPSSSSGKSSGSGHRQETTSLGGDGGNVEPGFDAEGGWGRDEAVSLLRRFYVQENGRAPVPRKKEGRAARLAAMEQAGSEGNAGMGPASTAVEATNNTGTASACIDVDQP
ncbi:tRNA-specific adenosine deaminase TAD2 [Colletotrichum sidae]|uniref:tRNA-specific adenosine deaminase TAD2 n=1 Tax=Colletotrichum sidae TaxID=1347389 RepID=A0A4R8SUT8_9PEZI|nr:tRNA-specific adenosine deaminase TAD2 [Colletotrichum sidae]